MLSRVFIDRPDLRVGAWRSSSCSPASARILGLPVAQYPDVAPPQVTIQRHLSGRQRADASRTRSPRWSSSQLTGIDGLLYFQSASSEQRGR